MSEEKLKLCLFCGGEAEFERIGTPRYSTIIRCTNCGVSLESGETWNHGDQWNNRIPDPRVEELTEALDKACKSVSELIDESRGVDGLHLNGDVAPWEDLRTGGRYEGWLVDFDEALQVLRKYKAEENMEKQNESEDNAVREVEENNGAE